MGDSYVVLGGKGFIGSHLIEELSKSKARVKCFDRPDPVRAAELYSFDYTNVEVVEGDFLNEGDLKRALRGTDVCFHLVSTTLPANSNDDPVFDIETNVAGTVRLLQACIEEGVKKIIFISSGGTVYGTPQQIPISEDHPTDPICSYGITKLAIEKYLALFHHLYGLDYRVLRVSNAYGERQRIKSSQGVIAVFLAKALRNEQLEIWGDGSVVRDYIHVSDVIKALIKVTVYRGKHRIFNIGSGQGKNLNEVIDVIEKVIDRKVKKQYIKSRKFDVPVNILDTSLARAELKWIPETSFEEGIKCFAEWLDKKLK